MSTSIMHLVLTRRNPGPESIGWKPSFTWHYGTHNIYGTVLQIPQQNDQYTIKGIGRDFGMQPGGIENISKYTCFILKV